MRLLLAARPLLEAGVPMRAVAGRVGTSVATLSRLVRQCAGREGISAVEMAPEYDRCGRAPVHELTEEEALALRGHVLAKSTGTGTGQTRFLLAVEQFAGHPACREETRAFILAELDMAAACRRAPRWPAGWRRGAYPTRQEAGLFRGRKAALATQQTERRALEWVDESGARLPMGPHTLWEMDDMSCNEPAASVDPDTGEPILTRQVLYTQDVYSAALLGFTQVARSRDAYRTEDVADHVRDSFAAHGMPAILRLEMGKIWAGSFFEGFVPAVPGWPREERWGGLSPLVRVVHTHQSKGKGGIEGAFNLVQAMGAHQALGIGRVRGEFEEATRAVTRGEIERFWTLPEAGDGLERVSEWFNARPKRRAALGRELVAPVDLLRGARGPDLPPGEAWRLCPVKRVATVRGGHVEVTLKHYPRPFRWVVNGVDGAHLDHGYRVLVAFHPGRPEEGCHVFNAELGPRNRDGLKRGERILVAPAAEWVPQVDLSGRADFTVRKAASAAAVRNFRAIGATLRTASVQDSHGRVERGQAGGAVVRPQAGSRPAAARPAPGRTVAPARTEEDLADLDPGEPAVPRERCAGGGFAASLEDLAELM